MLPDCSIRKALEREGYAVVKAAFSLEEITWLRHEAEELLAKKPRTVNGGLCVGPIPRGSGLGRLLLDGHRLARQCGEQFPWEIHVHSDTYNNWHADFKPLDQDEVFSRATAWMYKIVIYLQDHLERDGLSVVPRSHKNGTRSRAPLHIDTRAGDMVIFNQSVRHAGRFPNRAERVFETFADALYRTRLIPYIARRRLQRWFRQLERLLQRTPASERLAIFVTFAPESEIAQRCAELRAGKILPTGWALSAKVRSWFDCTKLRH